MQSYCYSVILVCPSCKDSDPVTPEGEDPELPIENKITKIKDIVIYENPEFYVTSPSVVKNDGEYLVAFRSAPTIYYLVKLTIRLLMLIVT